MLRLGMEEDVPIESKLITKRIAAAQKAVEAQNFAARKHLIEYDDVMNKQREVIYTQRREILAGQEIRESFLEMLDETIEEIVAAYAIDRTAASEWDWQGIGEMVFKCFNMHLDLPQEMLSRLNPVNFQETLKSRPTPFSRPRLPRWVTN